MPHGDPHMSTSAATLATDHPTSTAATVRAGLVGGAIAGIAFAMFEMMAAAVLNGPDAFFMPLRMIGAIGLGASALDPSSSLVTAGAVGLVIHMALSMMYGLVVALVASGVTSIRRTTGSLVAFASAAGFALWILNFFLLAGALGWSWFPDSQNAAVQFAAHTVMFGSVLGLLLDRLAFRATR